MTGRALRVEERFARLRIADDDARRLHPRFVVPRSFEGVDEGRNVARLLAAERELRHPAIRASALDDWRHQLTVLIVEDDRRAQEARPAVAAACVGTMAELAVHGVERLAAIDRRRIAGGPLGIRRAGRDGGAAAAAPAALGRRLRMKRESAPNKGRRERKAR